mgnify:CR=1 FL=1
MLVMLPHECKHDVSTAETSAANPDDAAMRANRVRIRMKVKVSMSLRDRKERVPCSEHKCSDTSERKWSDTSYSWHSQNLVLGLLVLMSVMFTIS